VTNDPVDIPPSSPGSWRYANYFQIGTTENELIIDFALHFEGMDEPRWHTRIILAISTAQQLEDILIHTLHGARSNHPLQ
jgi:hypothetical protein